jgi:hypothetical protein
LNVKARGPWAMIRVVSRPAPVMVRRGFTQYR